MGTYESVRPALAGLAGGSLATLTLHPLDLLKTRQSVHGNGADSKARESYQKLGSAIKLIVEKEGGVKGLYAGVGANVLVSGSSWGIYFMSYGTVKSMILGNRPADTQLGLGEQTVAAFGAGAVTTLLTNPLNVVRTRMVVKDKADVQFRSVGQALAHIRAKEGVRGLYKGVFPSLLNVSHGAIQLMAYEHFKQGLRNWKGEKDLTLGETLGACASSKVVAALITYPCQNVRACQQAAIGGGAANAANNSSLSILRREGLRGLYRGLGPYLLHVVPNVCMVFMVYEAIVGNNNFTFAGKQKE